MSTNLTNISLPADFKFQKDELLAMQRIHIQARYQKGEFLVQQGQPLENTYTVLEGCVRTYVIHEGVETTLDFFTEGQGVLPSSVSSRVLSNCYIECLEPCLIGKVSLKAEAEIFEQFPRIKEVCRHNSEALLLEQQAEVARLKSLSPQKRYEHLVANRPTLLKRVPQYQIASYLGITPESLSRLRKRLANRA